MDSPTDAPPGAGSPPPPPPPSPRPRRLVRRPDDGHLGGVCAGVAEYFDVDPVIVRIAAVVLAFSGPGVGAYVLAWIFIPEAKGPRQPGGVAASGAGGKDKGAQIFGIVLLGLSAAFLWGDWWSPARRWFLPFGLMALGAWLVLRGNEHRRDANDMAQATGPGDVGGEADAELGSAETGAPPAEGALLEPTTEPFAPGGDDPTDGDPDRGSRWQDHLTAPWAHTHAQAHAAAASAVAAAMDPAERAARRRRRAVTPSVLGALLVWGGAAALLGVSLQTGLAVALCIVGIGFVVGAFMGGAWALLGPAVVLASALIAVTAIDIPLRGPIGDRQWAPASADAVEDVYEMSLGEGTLDLRDLDLSADERLEVTATMGVGHLVVELPPGAGVEIVAEAGAGETDLLGSKNSGMGVEATAAAEAAPGSGTIVLDLQVGVGQVEVRQLPSAATELR